MALRSASVTWSASPLIASSSDSARRAVEMMAIAHYVAGTLAEI
jgi:hypothetical protein